MALNNSLLASTTTTTPRLRRSTRLSQKRSSATTRTEASSSDDENPSSSVNKVASVTKRSRKAEDVVAVTPSMTSTSTSSSSFTDDGCNNEASTKKTRTSNRVRATSSATIATTEASSEKVEIKSTKGGRKKSKSTVATQSRSNVMTPTNNIDDGSTNDTSDTIVISPISPVSYCLPRTHELHLLSTHTNNSKNLTIIGVDEAGRGPLAGPVVAAAAIVPMDVAGVIDSKKIVKEEERERLYEEIVSSPGVRYAVAVVSAGRIDEINILEATLEGMRMAVQAVISMDDGIAKKKKGRSAKKDGASNDNIASAERNEASYVIKGGDNSSRNIPSNGSSTNHTYHALIDGNKIPPSMPCPSTPLTKGDGREYSIAAASILAKVTRDRLMHQYATKYPEYDLGRHKGYPTAAHMERVREFGASPIHRRSFAPLKFMRLDEEGKVLEKL